eukprot:g2612.t1
MVVRFADSARQPPNGCDISCKKKFSKAKPCIRIVGTLRYFSTISGKIQEQWLSTTKSGESAQSSELRVQTSTTYHSSPDRAAGPAVHHFKVDGTSSVQ